ncbi:RasGEF domain-containing protein [Parachlamydia acanthamoebae]|jgi:hypothetical protein|uniref:Ras-GEF domain-containing protein n=2 Tax=Parachlamydia acanthamoebae TaxID=83552 RepID=F8KZH2_PARAV|nr:RasGEF domain-containing protein [Parachlamydia acanthamoebae]EFB41801.1 hypothetical protein pah_c022o089 [Parachlamydia acanthamoebae str. Hall's coccus]KIA77967.1 hypothetical protein DB43_FG00260 [Parachlamydia acanthamoebae]CCB86312.1 putative uncharacterized protein [Parachlamydia acanthamoebae UV-7]
MENMQIPNRSLVQPFVPPGAVSSGSDKASLEKKPAMEAKSSGRKFVESQPGDSLAQVTDKIKGLSQSLKQMPAVKTPPPLPTAPKPPLVDRRQSLPSRSAPSTDQLIMTSRESLATRKPPPAPPSQPSSKVTERQSFPQRKPVEASQTGQVTERQSFPQRRAASPAPSSVRHSAPDILTQRAKPLPPTPKITQILERSPIGKAIASHRMAKGEQLQGLHNMKLDNIAPKEETKKAVPPQFTPKSEIDAVSSKSVSKLSDLAKKQPVNKELTKEIASTLRREADAYFKNLDLHGLATKKIDKKGEVPSYDALANFSQNISFSVGKEILGEKNVGKRAALLSFYAQVGKDACEMGDFCTGMAIYSTLSSTSIDRLKQTANVLSQDGKDANEYLKNVFDPGENFKNLRTAENKFKEKGLTPLPAPGVLSRAIIIGGSENKAENLGEVFEKILKPLVAIKETESTPPIPRNATILKMFSFEDTKEFNGFIKENIKKLEAQAKEFGMQQATVKTRDEHIKDYLQSLSLKREPRK